MGDHAAKREAESAVKQIKRQDRVLKSSVKQKLPHVLADPIDHVVIARATCLTRYRIGEDGKTECSTGTKWVV